MSSSHRGRGREGGRGGKGRGSLPRDIVVSKALSKLLRHQAELFGLKLGEGGYVNVKDVLATPPIRTLHVTPDEIASVVATNNKQRFSLAHRTTPSSPLSDPTDLAADPSAYLIRANQGHSIAVDATGLLEPLTLADGDADAGSGAHLPDMVVHGTTNAAWPLIVASGGLKPMGRNHVHFAAGLPAGFAPLEPLPATRELMDAPPVISGMRSTSSVLIFIDLPKALAAGVDFWRSSNGVILSAGNADGVVPLDVFLRVEARKRGGKVLLRDGKLCK
ncbi:phosphotransferase KptA/Tpt1 [Lineolata rhizophorae]|uniref:2'-phosphotransferase n=1 Tax=Lineolata rhizophorae TaxID=578093 RepID=A0A6A6NWG3_9PEZI|nr:phosphotransferase KptA/Tpt1 [Lineolata rhizophorae]